MCQRLVVLARESWCGYFFPPLWLSNFMLVTWNQPCRRYFYDKNGQMQQIRTLLNPNNCCWTFTNTLIRGHDIHAPDRGTLLNRVLLNLYDKFLAAAAAYLLSDIYSKSMCLLANWSFNTENLKCTALAHLQLIPEVQVFQQRSSW